MISIFAKLERAIDKRSLDETRFRDLLKRTGFKPGGVVMTHTSMEEVARRVSEMTPSAVVSLMKDLVSPGGTILMPAFDTDAIAEAFRLSDGVVSSIHPTHPVTAWGKHARSLTATHHVGGTFDTFSPFYKLREHDGVVIGIGAGLESFSIIHVAEELHPAARLRVFEKEVRTLQMSENNVPFEYAYRTMRRDVERRYDFLEQALLKDGTLRHLNEAGLKCCVLASDVFLRRSMDFVFVRLQP